MNNVIEFIFGELQRNSCRLGMVRKFIRHQNEFNKAISVWTLTVAGYLALSEYRIRTLENRVEELEDQKGE